MMSQHGIGRGGRGFSFLSNRAEDEKPGISRNTEEIPDTSSLSDKIQNLLLGRGKTTSHESLGYPNKPIGRAGEKFGSSGTFWGKIQESNLGKVSSKQVSSPVDPNDNVVTVSSPDTDVEGTEPTSVSLSPQTFQSDESKGAIPKHKQSLHPLGGRGRGLQHIFEMMGSMKQLGPEQSVSSLPEDPENVRRRPQIKKEPISSKGVSMEDLKAMIASQRTRSGGTLGPPRGSGRGIFTGAKSVSVEKKTEVSSDVISASMHDTGMSDVAKYSKEKLLSRLGGERQALVPSSGGRGASLRLLLQKSTLAEKEVKLRTLPKSSEHQNIQVDSPNQLQDFSVARREVVEYRGSTGLKVPVQVNCVWVKCRNDAVYQYHVSFDPPIDNRNMRYNLLNQHRDVIGHTKAFDGSILYLPVCLKHPETILLSKRITDDVEIRLKISLTKAIHPASHTLLSFYNIVLHRCMKILKMCPVGRNYYDPASAQPVPKYKLHLWPGYVTAIREMEGGLLLNIDTSHKVLRNETVLSLMQDMYQHHRENFHAQCIKELVGTTVLTRYNNNNYRVDDIDWNTTPRSTFTTSRGETLSFFDYYKAQYRIEIKDLNQPMLVNRPKKATQRSKRVEQGEERILLLVPELCFLTGLTERLAGDFTAMKEIGNFTRLGPQDRRMQIEGFLRRINQSQEAKQELLRWGLEMDTSILSLSGRNFPPEKVLIGRNHVFTCGDEADFSREVSRNPVIRGVPITHWILVFTSRDQSKAKDFVQKLVEVSGKLAMLVMPPKFIELRDDRSDSFKHAISAAVNPLLQLVVCIFPTLREDRYSAVKRLCCVDMPVPSQVILSKTLPRDSSQGKFRSVTIKIALQINCKLGGELWALDIPLSGLMVCGIDVFHEGKSGKGKSVAALVASMNKLVTRWYSRAVIQLPQQEIIDSLKHCFCDTLTKYYEINHRLPERIIIYRDGVGDGRLPMVAEHEVLQLRESLKMFDNIAGGRYSPKLTIVVVSKRVNIRYFKITGKQLSNPSPGTVVDHVVTRPNWPDFYLVSQHVRQGTVSPTHYLAIHGHEHLKCDHLQRLTYKMTHMYYNWPGTVRVPAPCQYAHKMAYLVGENIRKEPALDLCDRLFYL